MAVRHKMTANRFIAGNTPFWLVAGPILLFPLPALAYLDPVTGSFAIQGIVAAVMAGLASVRALRDKARKLWSRAWNRIVGRRTQSGERVATSEEDSQ